MAAMRGWMERQSTGTCRGGNSGDGSDQDRERARLVLEGCGLVSEA